MASYLLAAASPPGAPVWAVQPLPLDAGPTAVLAAGAAGELRLLAPLPSGSAACLATHAHSSNGASSSNGDAGSSSSSSAGSGIGVFAVAVAGERVLSVAADGSVALWQLDLAAVAQAAERAAALEAQPDSAESASPSSSDAPLLRALAAVPTLAPHLEAHAVALHPTQPLLAAVGAGPRVALCSAAPEDFGALQRMCDAPNAQAGASRGGKGASTEMATCVAFSPSGELLASGTSAGLVLVHAVASGRLLATFADHALPIRSLSFSAPNVGAERDHLHVCSEDRTLTIHDVRSLERNAASAAAAQDAAPAEAAGIAAGATVACLRHPGWVTGASAGPLLATSSTDGALRLYDTRAGRTCVATLREGPRIWACVWTPPLAGLPPSTAMLVSGSESGEVRWYRAAGTGLGAAD